MPLGMASCPLDFPRPGFLPAGFSAAWRLVRWIFRGMASFPLDFSRLRFSLGSSPRRRPRGYERGLARGARRCRLPRRFAKITTMHACQQRQRISGLSNRVRNPHAVTAFFGCAFDRFLGVLRAGGTLFFLKRELAHRVFVVAPPFRRSARAFIRSRRWTCTRSWGASSCGCRSTRCWLCARASIDGAVGSARFARRCTVEGDASDSGPRAWPAVGGKGGGSGGVNAK